MKKMATSLPEAEIRGTLEKQAGWNHNYTTIDQAQLKQEWAPLLRMNPRASLDDGLTYVDEQFMG